MRFVSNGGFFLIPQYSGEHGSPHRIGYITVLWNPQELVWSGNRVDIGTKTVVEVCIGLPYFLQHLHIETELINGQRMGILLHPRETQPLVSPILTKVAIHRVVLKQSQCSNMRAYQRYYRNCEYSFVSCPSIWRKTVKRSWLFHYRSHPSGSGSILSKTLLPCLLDTRTHTCNHSSCISIRRIPPSTLDK